MIAHNEPIAPYGQKPSVLDLTDLSACANKIRQPGYYAPNGYNGDGRMSMLWIEGRSTVECKYDRKQVDPACAAAKCERIGGDG
jgi:hypothetical protein